MVLTHVLFNSFKVSGLHGSDPCSISHLFQLVFFYFTRFIGPQINGTDHGFRTSFVRLVLYQSQVSFLVDGRNSRTTLNGFDVSIHGRLMPTTAITPSFSRFVTTPLWDDLSLTSVVLSHTIPSL